MLFSTRCTTIEKNKSEIFLSPGETAMRSKNFCFYIGTGGKIEDQKTLNLTSSILTELIADPVWFIPQGISIETSTIDVYPTTIKWRNSGMEYKAPGVRIDIDYEVTADTSVSAGKGEIFIEFENLNLLKGNNYIYMTEDGSCYGNEPIANTEFQAWKLNNVVVFENAEEKESATKESNAGSRFIIGFILLIVGFSVIYGFYQAWEYKNK